MNGGIFPQYAFMAWFSVKKAQGQLYLLLGGHNREADITFTDLTS